MRLDFDVESISVEPSTNGELKVTVEMDLGETDNLLDEIGESQIMEWVEFNVEDDDLLDTVDIETIRKYMEKNG